MKSAEGMGARPESCLLVFDENAGVGAKPSDASHHPSATLTAFAVARIHTGRERTDELGRRGGELHAMAQRVLAPLPI